MRFTLPSGKARLSKGQCEGQLRQYLWLPNKAHCVYSPIKVKEHLPAKTKMEISRFSKDTENIKATFGYDTVRR